MMSNKKKLKGYENKLKTHDNLFHEEKKHLNAKALMTKTHEYFNY